MQLKGCKAAVLLNETQDCFRGKYSGKREGNVFFMNSNAIAAKKKVDSAFMKKGVFIAIMSGVTYGLYTGFLTLGQASGVWGADWYGANTSGLSVFAVTFILGSL